MDFDYHSAWNVAVAVAHYMAIGFLAAFGFGIGCIVFAFVYDVWLSGVLAWRFNRMQRGKDPNIPIVEHRLFFPIAFPIALLLLYAARAGWLP